MARKKSLTEDESEWLIAYVRNWFSKNAESRMVELWGAFVKWRFVMNDPAPERLLEWARENLNREELDSLFGYLQTKRNEKKHALSSITISEEAHRLLRNWKTQTGQKNLSQSVVKLIEIAHEVRRFRPDLLETLDVHDTAIGKNTKSVPITQEAHELLKGWRDVRRHQNLSQTMLELVNIAQHAAKG